MTIVLATQNKNKVKEIEYILSFLKLDLHVVTAKEVGICVSPEETGDTFSENAFIKAEAIFNYIKENNCIDKPYVVMADDSGIAIDALGGKPGVYSARYASTNNEDVKDGDNVKKLLKDMEKIPFDKRDASFICSIAIITDDGKRNESIGKLSGVLAFEPAGESGFGYDPIMFIPSENCTVAQMGPQKKNEISHRSNAIKKVVEIIKSEYKMGE